MFSIISRHVEVLIHVKSIEAQTSSHWCGEEVKTVVPAQVSSSSLDHGSKLRVNLEVVRSESSCAQRVTRSRASHSCWIPSLKIYGVGRGGDASLERQASRRLMNSCRRRWSSRRNAVARDGALRLVEAVSERTSLLAVQ
ncbi:hypothetical protein TNCV_1136141 [Trichonephila clavipes]|nr:hypothetical protein TNCV_1136141 [Trichonephila clavipes]